MLFTSYYLSMFIYTILSCDNHFKINTTRIYYILLARKISTLNLYSVFQFKSLKNAIWWVPVPRRYNEWVTHLSFSIRILYKLFLFLYTFINYYYYEYIIWYLDVCKVLRDVMQRERKKIIYVKRKRKGLIITICNYLPYHTIIIIMHRFDNFIVFRHRFFFSLFIIRVCWVSSYNIISISVDLLLSIYKQ